MPALPLRRRGRRRHRRLRRRRRHARQRAAPEGRTRSSCSRRAATTTPEDFVNDEWRSFKQLAWLDKRTTSGSFRVAQGLPQPAGVDLQDRRRHDRALGGLLPALHGARVQGLDVLRRHRRRQRARLADLARRPRAVLRPRRGQARLHRHERHPAAAGQQQLQGVRQRRPARRLQALPHRPLRLHPVPRDGRPATNQDGFNFQGVKDRSKWSTLYRRAAARAATGKLDLRPESHVIRDRARRQGLATGVTYVDGDGLEQFQRARLVAVAGNAIETPRLLLNSAIDPVPRRPRELVRPGRAQLHAPPDRVGVRDLRPAGAHLPRRDDGRPHRGRGAERPVARVRRRLLPAAARRSACRSWRRSWTRAAGAATSLGARGLREHGRPVARRRGHAAGEQPRDAQPRRARPVRPAGPERALRRPPERPRHARARVGGRRGALRVRRRGAHDPHPAVPGDAQHRHRADERAARGRRRQRVRPGPRRAEPVRLRRQPVHDGRRGEPDADDRRARHPPGRVHHRAAAQRSAIPTGHAVVERTRSRRAGSRRRRRELEQPANR